MDNFTRKLLRDLSGQSALTDLMKQNQRLIDQQMQTYTSIAGIGRQIQDINKVQIDAALGAVGNTGLTGIGTAIDQWGLTQNAIAQGLTGSAHQILQQISGIGRDWRSVFAGIYDISSLLESLERLRIAEDAGEAALTEADFQFLITAVKVSAFASYRYTHRQTASASMTNVLNGMVRGSDFAESLSRDLQASSLLGRRNDLITLALDAHRERKYAYSIPILLAQFEGTIADAMIVKGSVTRDGNKLYCIDGQGGFELDKKGKRIAVNGLFPLVTRSKWSDHDTLKGMAELVTATLATNRNGILHGANTNYHKEGACKLSITLLINIMVLAKTFSEFENGTS